MQTANNVPMKIGIAGLALSSLIAAEPVIDNRARPAAGKNP